MVTPSASGCAQAAAMLWSAGPPFRADTVVPAPRPRWTLPLSAMTAQAALVSRDLSQRTDGGEDGDAIGLRVRTGRRYALVRGSAVPSRHRSARPSPEVDVAALGHDGSSRIGLEGL